MSERDSQILDDASRVDDALCVRLPALDLQARRWVDQVAVGVQVECSVAREALDLTIAQHEEAVSSDGQVGGFARRLQAALRLNDVDAGYFGAQADLLGIDAAQPALWSGTGLDGLREQIAEGHAAGFVTGGINVCQVIADCIHEELMVTQT